MLDAAEQSELLRVDRPDVPEGVVRQLAGLTIVFVVAEQSPSARDRRNRGVAEAFASFGAAV